MGNVKGEYYGDEHVLACAEPAKGKSKVDYSSLLPDSRLLQLKLIQT